MSRNKTEGRYAGKTKGKHVRACNSQMALTKCIFNDRLYWIPNIPESETAWRVMQVRAIK